MLVRGVLAAALRFRMLLVGIAAGLIAVGVLALPNMHADVLPELSQGPVLEVQTESPGLSSQEVEQYITVPIENNLLDGVMGVWDVRSQSTPGLSTVDLYFEPGVTTLHARQLVEERLTNSFSLPAVNKPPLLIQPLSSTSRALMIGLNAPSGMSPLELSYLARWVVKPRLSGRPGSRERRDLRPAGPPDPGPGRPREARGAAHHAAADHRHRRATRSSSRR